jgi:hypothetical protein
MNKRENPFVYLQQYNIQKMIYLSLESSEATDPQNLARPGLLVRVGIHSLFAEGVRCLWVASTPAAIIHARSRSRPDTLGFKCRDLDVQKNYTPSRAKDFQPYCQLYPSEYI